MTIKLSVAPFQVSHPSYVPAGTIVSITPDAGANATVEYTKGSAADIQNNVAVWAPWAKGGISAVTQDVVGKSGFIRVSAFGGNVAVAINKTPVPAEVAALMASDWASSAQTTSTSSNLSYDVVVYGATFSGVMAAVSAKKNGASVVIIDPRDEIGGMVTDGIAYTDSSTPTNKLRSTIAGQVNEFYADAARLYSYDQQTFYQAQNYSLEPKHAQRLVDRLIQKWSIPVYTFAKLTAVAKTGTVITSATFDTLGTVMAKQFIDASYPGDFMAMAGCTWTIGREDVRSGAFSGELALAGGFQLATGTQPTANIDPYITPGNPASGLIWGVQTNPGSATGAADGKVMAMGYRLCVTNDASKVSWPFTSGNPPANYDVSRYEVLKRHIAANGTGWNDFTNVFLVQPALPTNESALAGKKFDINNKQIMSLDYIHPESTEYATATWARRAQIESNIKDYTLGLLYFLCYDLSVPSAVRASVLSYGFCPDEYLGNGGLPKYPYCREGRRLVGTSIVKGSDLTTIAALSTAVVAQAYYTMDSHAIQYIDNGGKVSLEGQMAGVAASPGAKIPRTILQPNPAECTNLLVSWCGSMSHTAFASLRMEPIAGALGEAAGLIAALAIKKGLSVQTVPSLDINKYLNLYGWNDPGALVISTDGSYANGSVVASASGYSVVNTALFGTTSILSCALTSGVNTVTFTPSTTLLQNGQVDIYAKWSDNLPTSGSRGSPTFTVTANGVVTSIPVNQNNSGEGGDWFYLGRFYMRKGAGASNNVVITHDNTANPTNIVGMKFIPFVPTK